MSFYLIKLHKPIKFTTDIMVQPRDVDINGHVHHSVYLDYLLTARYDQMKRGYKMSMDEFNKMGFTWVARKYDITYKSGIKLNDTAVVTTWISTIGHMDVLVNFIITSKNTRRVAARGSARFILLDIQTKKPVKIPDKVIEKYSLKERCSD